MRTRVIAGNIAVNLPLSVGGLTEQLELIPSFAKAGYRALWANEYNSYDGLGLLCAVAARHPRLELASVITNVYTRGPALLAMAAATVAELSQAPFMLAIGSSSTTIVSDWNGIDYLDPYQRVADTLVFLQDALTTGRCDREFQTIKSEGFRLSAVPTRKPLIALGALGPRMQRLAARSADQMVTGMVAAHDIARIRENVDAVSRDSLPPLQLLTGVFLVPPVENADVLARRHLAAYLPVGGYLDLQRWLGRGPSLESMVSLWTSGDRRAAVLAIPQDVVDGLVVVGDAGEAARGVRRYLDAGFDGVNLMIPAGVPLTALEQSDFLCAVAKELSEQVLTP